METLTIIVADTLRVIGTNTCFPDTIICKVISSQENTCSNNNWTWVFITAIIAVVLLAWIISKAILRYKKMKLEDKSHYVELLLDEYAKKNINNEAVEYLKHIIEEKSFCCKN